MATRGQAPPRSASEDLRREVRRNCLLADVAGPVLAPNLALSRYNSAMGVDREKLYQEVWAEPMTSVASRYKVSGSFLARVCDRLGVPRPPRGYWVQLKVGKAPARPALPSPKPGDELEWTREGEPRRAPRELPKAPTVLPAAETATSGVSAKHGLVVGVRELFEIGRTTDAGYLKPNKKLLADIFTTKETLGRALDVAGRLFSALERRGHRVFLAPVGPHCHHLDVDHREKPTGERHYSERWSPARPTVVTIGTVMFGLSLYELSENVEVRHTNGQYVRVPPRAVAKPPAAANSWRDWTFRKDMPTGRLCLKAYSPYPRAKWERLWPEAPRAKLKDNFAAVIADLEAAAPVLAELVAEGERQAEIEHRRWEEQRRKWEREEAERRQVQALKDSREQLLAIVDAWTLASSIENFFERAAGRAAELDESERDAVVARLERARKMFGGVDALRHFRAWKAPEER